MTTTDSETFTIVVRAAPGRYWADVPCIYRVRRLLKAALRQFGLRCVQIHTATEAEREAADGKPTDG